MQRETCERSGRCGENECPEICDNWKDSHIRIEKSQRKLTCKLTDKELLETGNQLSSSIAELGEVEAEEKAIKDQFKAQKSEVESRIKRLATLLGCKTEARDVDCVKTKNYAEGTVKVMRVDTKEIIEERELSEQECQHHFAIDVDEGEQTEGTDVHPELPVQDGAAQFGAGLAGEETRTDRQSAENPDVSEDYEDLITQAIEIITETGRASTSSLQRRLRIGYTRAARLMDTMEERGLVGPARGSEPREILIEGVGNQAGGEEQTEE